MNKNFKCTLSLFLSINLFLFFFNYSFCKCIFEDELNVAKIHIDTVEPKFELINVYNSNEQYSSYASKNHILKFQIKLTEKNIFVNNFNKSTIKYFVDDKEIFPTYLSFEIISSSSNYKIYELSLTNITLDGSLKIVVPYRTS